MGAGTATLVVASIFLVSFGGVAVIVWQAVAHHVPLSYVIGGLSVVIGTGFSLLNAGVTDDYLRQHFGGEENASRVRQLLRGGWIGVLIGAVMIAAEYFLGLGL
jgi:hypothetical protein